MTESKTSAQALPEPASYDWTQIVDDLNRLLRLRTTPIGMKLFATIEEMEAIPRIRRPKSVHTTDQIVAQAARLGFTIGITAKDLMLQILRHPYIKDGYAIGKLVEYAGAAVAALSVDERATMTNMAAEVGAFTGIVRPDEKVVEYLQRERGLAPGDVRPLLEGLYSDADAEWERVLEFDAGEIEPMVALPGDPGNGVFLGELGGTVKIDIAYAGSCTAGKKSDMDMYAAVFRDSLEQGKRVQPDV